MKRVLKYIAIVVLTAFTTMLFINKCEDSKPVSENEYEILLAENDSLKKMEALKIQKINSLTKLLDSAKKIRIESFASYKKTKERVVEEVKNNACDTVKLIEIYNNLSSSCDSVINAFSLESGIKDSTINTLIDINTISRKQNENKETQNNILLKENKSLDKKLRYQKTINKLVIAGSAVLSVILTYLSLK